MVVRLVEMYTVPEFQLEQSGKLSTPLPTYVAPSMGGGEDKHEELSDLIPIRKMHVVIHQ